MKAGCGVILVKKPINRYNSNREEQASLYRKLIYPYDYPTFFERPSFKME